MAPIPTVTYASLKDHTALPVIRTICSSGAPEFRVTSLPEYDFSSLLEEYSRAGRDGCNLRIFKRSITTANPPLPTGVISLMMSLHALSGHIFNDLSHALELPWEKYLAELHEFAADGDDELRVFGTADVERAWASLILVFDPASPRTCLVVFGKAVAVFSENMISVDASPTFRLYKESEGHARANEAGNGEKIAYYVRPNVGVYYTRGAGALMTPLSDQEYTDRVVVGNSSTFQNQAQSV